MNLQLTKRINFGFLCSILLLKKFAANDGRPIDNLIIAEHANDVIKGDDLVNDSVVAPNQ